MCHWSCCRAQEKVHRWEQSGVHDGYGTIAYAYIDLIM
jgi:hypothetical protein